MIAFSRMNAASLAAMAVAMIASPAVAQQVANPPASDATSVAADPADGTQARDEADEVVVTGSRIARPDLQSSAPVAVVSAQRIQETGAGNIQDVLATLPSVGQNISRTSSNFSSAGNGVATVNLRNLGSQRTLTLINGRRAAGLPGSSAVDVNIIPTDLVDRIEVLTGGASATYGSEAVAGVVNFILKDKFTGLRIRAQNTISDKGDAARQLVSVTGGIAFGEDRGHLVGNFTYDNDEGLRSRKRSFSATDVPNRSSYAAQGLFDVSNPNNAAQRQFLQGTGRTFTFDGNNVLKGYQGPNIDGYNRNNDRYLSLPVERYQGTLLGSFAFSDAFELYGEGEYIHTRSNSGLEPSAIANSGPGAALSFDGSAYAGIPISSPYVPAAVRAAAIANGVNVIQFRRRSNDIFNRSNQNERDYYRGVAGLRGNFGEKWGYDIYYEHSEGRDHTTSQSIYAPNYGAALDNEIGPDGQVRCSNAAARALGCSPLNIFGFNTVSPAAAQFLQTYTGPTRTVTLEDGSSVTLRNGANVAYDYLAKNSQDVVSGSVHGDLFSLWGGPIAVAAGGEYRREKSSEVFDPFTQAGLTVGNQLSNTRGRFNVKEVFGEVVAPIVEKRPFLEYLGLEGAIRYADYSTVGGVLSWKAGGTYAPTPDIRFRGIFSRATRAPNIGELFSAQSQTFPSVNDFCDQGTDGDITKLKPLPAACRNIPGIAQTIAAQGSFAYTTSQIQSIDGLTGGNRNLREETADTITAGAVFTPRFLPRFSLTADYYRIKVKNAIGIIGQSISVNQCVLTGNPLFCNNVVRNAQGFITRVNAINLNTGSYLVSGLDVEGNYSLPLNYWDRGQLNVNVRWNHRFDQQQTPFPGGDVQNEIGQADCYSCGRLGSGFRDRLTGNFTVGGASFRLNYRLDYLGPLSDNLDGSTSVVTRIPAFVYHNLQATFPVGETQRMELYLGVNNLTDKKPPQFGDTNPVTWPGTQTVADTYDLYGRMLYAGFTVKF